MWDNTNKKTRLWRYAADPRWPPVVPYFDADFLEDASQLRNEHLDYYRSECNYIKEERIEIKVKKK
jgi:hypothetical protein